MADEHTDYRQTGRLENLFSQIGKHLDDFADKARTSEARQGFEDRIDDLKGAASQIEDDFKAWKGRHHDSWKDTEQKMERTATIIKDGLRDIVNKIREDGKQDEED